MTFLLGKLGWLLFCPSNLLLAVLLPVGQWLRLPLEERFPQPGDPPHVDGVIALGGGVDPEVTAHHGQPAIGGTAERFTTLVALARRWPEARLAFTGGIGRIGGAPMTEAAAIGPFLAGLGLDSRRLLLQDEARTTRENAIRVNALLRPKPGEIWLLVTSASHMPRSVGAFR